MTPHALIAPARLAGAQLLRAQSDERLVDLVRADNDAAFEAIVARYRRALLRYCSGFLSEARAEDVVQTAFVNALSSLRSSHGEMELRPWLYRIAHNTALNALRDRALAHEELSEEVHGIEPPDQTFEKGERFRDVVAALGALPERQRDAMVLREIEGRSYDEIASELGVSNGSVRQLLNRARNTLRSGATALTPLGLLVRVPWAGGPGESMATRVAEICAGGAGAAALTKVCATALVTGAVVGGVAGSPSGGIDEGRARDDRGSAVARPAQGAALGARNGPGPVGSAEPAADEGADRDRDSDSGRSDERSGRDEGDDEDEGRRGRGRGDRDDPADEVEDRSGPGDGDSRNDFDDSFEGGSSGPGNGESVDSQGPDDEVDSPIDNSGPGSLSSGPGSSGSGSGSGDSGSGSGGSG